MTSKNIDRRKVRSKLSAKGLTDAQADTAAIRNQSRKDRVSAELDEFIDKVNSDYGDDDGLEDVDDLQCDELYRSDYEIQEDGLDLELGWTVRMDSDDVDE